MRAGRFTALLLAAVLALIAAATVQADRKPTVKERKAVAAIVDLPAKCAHVRISTVTEKPKWASVSFRPHSPESCQPFASDGVTVAKKRSGRWRFVTAGSSFDCPDLYKDVPVSVAQDLGIDCR